MPSQSNKGLNENFILEYEVFIKQHLFPLLGIVNKDLRRDVLFASDFKSAIIQKDSCIYFGYNGCRIFSIQYPVSIPEDSLRLARSVLQRFFYIAEYKRTGSAKKNSYFSDEQRNSVHSMAVQKGICDWIAWVPGSKKADNDSRESIEKLFSKLEKWAVKTYEGKHVTLGFVIDPALRTIPQNTYGSWLEFLDDDCSSLLTDCIHSVIELDGHCNFVEYKSISESDAIETCPLQNEIPLRFMHIIQKYVTDKKIGIFLLNNGDIILSKKQRVCFVKRNLRWLNLSFEAFECALEPFINSHKETEKKLHHSLLSSVFASVLDVSFSHAGGIIAVVGGSRWEEDTDMQTKQSLLLDPCDNLLNRQSCSDLKVYKMKDAQNLPQSELRIKEIEVNKRLQKRVVLSNLIKGKDFISMDRKLRSELIGLDGACILDFMGNVYSYGAIIQNDSGSTGGGRGAAAKKLSTYGLAVKVSTDGYIELYVSGECIYEIK